MYKKLQPVLEKELEAIREAGLFKKERIITTPQAADIKTNGKAVINFCANNYLGLSSHPRVIEAAKRAIDTHGFGMSSVRFICGTQDIHKEPPFYTPQHSMPMAVCLNHCLVRKMPLSLMN
jgi:glycine C-acetyltransferase